MELPKVNKSVRTERFLGLCTAQITEGTKMSMAVRVNCHAKECKTDSPYITKYIHPKKISKSSDLIYIM